MVSFNPSFFAPFKGNYHEINQSYNQWFSTDVGRRLLAKELAEMERFPFETRLRQDHLSHDLSYLSLIKMNGIVHQVLMKYDHDHPDYEMEVTLLSPTLDMDRMPGHSYGQNRPCYVESWSRKFMAIHVAMQVTSWLSDYYKGTYCSGFRNLNPPRRSNYFLERVQRELDFYRRF